MSTTTGAGSSQGTTPAEEGQDDSRYEIIHVWDPEREVLVHTRLRRLAVPAFEMAEEVLCAHQDRMDWMERLPSALRILLRPLHIVFAAILMTRFGWYGLRHPGEMTVADYLDAISLAVEVVKADDAADRIKQHPEEKSDILKWFYANRADYWSTFGRDAATESRLAALRPVCPHPDEDMAEAAVNAKGSNLVQ